MSGWVCIPYTGAEERAPGIQGGPAGRKTRSVGPSICQKPAPLEGELAVSRALGIDNQFPSFQAGAPAGCQGIVRRLEPGELNWAAAVAARIAIQPSGSMQDGV